MNKIVKKRIAITFHALGLFILFITWYHENTSLKKINEIGANIDYIDNQQMIRGTRSDIYHATSLHFYHRFYLDTTDMVAFRNFKEFALKYCWQVNNIRFYDNLIYKFFPDHYDSTLTNIEFNRYYNDTLRIQSVYESNDIDSIINLAQESEHYMKLGKFENGRKANQLYKIGHNQLTENEEIHFWFYLIGSIFLGLSFFIQSFLID